MGLIMKIFNVFIFLATLSLSIGLFGMESKDKSEINKPVSRPKRTDKDTENLGIFGNIPDDAILSIALQLLNQTDSKKAYQDFVNLFKTNKYINELLKSAATEKNFGAAVKNIREEIVELINQIKRIKKYLSKDVIYTTYIKTKSDKENYINTVYLAVDLCAIQWIKLYVINANFLSAEERIKLINDIFARMVKRSLIKKTYRKYKDIEINLEDFLELVEILIENGADVNMHIERKYTSRTILNLFLQNPFLFSFAKLLLDNGAIIDKETQEMIDENSYIKEFINDYKKEKQSGKQEE